jgi:hypothetical protein
MVHLLIGAFCATILFLFLRYAGKKDSKPGRSKLLIIILEIIFIAFVIELIYGFFQEGAFKGALIMGLMFGFPCIVAGILIYRWTFSTKKSNSNE